MIKKKEITSTKLGRKKLRDDPMLLDEIEKFIRVKGIYDISASEVKNHLNKVKQVDPTMKDLYVPSEQTIIKVLKEHFHLRYGRL